MTSGAATQNVGGDNNIFSNTGAVSVVQHFHQYHRTPQGIPLQRRPQAGLQTIRISGRQAIPADGGGSGVHIRLKRMVADGDAER